MSYSIVLKSLRKKNNMTQVVAAKAIDVTAAYLSKVENGSKVPSMVLLKKMSEVYKIPLSIINYLASKDEITKMEKPKEFEVLHELINEMIQYLFIDGSYNLKKFSSDFKKARKLKVAARQFKIDNAKKYNNVSSKMGKASEGKSKYGKK